MSRAHAKFAPSSAHIWTQCIGSVNHKIKDAPESDAARLGTAVHSIIETILKNPHLKNASHLLGTPTENGVIVTQKMIDDAQIMIEEVRKVTMTPKVEKRVRINEKNWGTIDALFEKDDTLYLWDYKNGYRSVGAFENLQLANYALSRTKFRMYEVFIIQPNDFKNPPVKHWSATREELEPLWSKINRALRAKKLKYKTGLHCRDCKLRLTCSALRESTINLFEHVTDNITTHEIETHRLTREYAQLFEFQNVLKSRVNAIHDELYFRAERDNTLEEKQSSLRWAAPRAHIEKIFGDSCLKHELITPTQLMKKRPFLKSVVEQLSERKTTKILSTRSTDHAEIFKKSS